MIVLDTHIWVWWVHGDSTLSASTRALLVTVDGKIQEYPHVKLTPTNA